MDFKEIGFINRIIGSSALAAFSHRNFRLFYFGQIVSVIGFWMQNVALAWVVLELTDSAFLLGLVTFIQFVPNLLFSLVAGVIADRLPRRRLIIGTQVGFTLLALILTILSATSMLNYWHIASIGALMGVLHALDIPARQSFLVEMVGRKDLTNAIALNSTMFNAARVLGPALGGIVLARYSATTCFLLNAISYFFVIFSLVAMKIEKRNVVKKSKDVLAQIKDGLNYILVTPTVSIPMALLASVSISAMNFGVLVPVFARNILGQGPAGYGILVSSLGIGSLAGAISLIIFNSHHHQLRFLWSGALGLSLSQLLLGQMMWYWPSAVLLMCAGWCIVGLSASVNSIIQVQVPDDLRGRVMSVYSLSFIGFSSLGGMMAGAVAKWFGSPIAFTAGGLVALLATLCLARRWCCHFQEVKGN